MSQAGRTDEPFIPPRPETLFGSERLDAPAAVSLTELRISQSASLADLVRDGYVLFTPAVLYSVLPLTVDVVQDYVNEAGVDLTVGALQSPQPIFAGLRDQPPWNHTILVADLEGWPGLGQRLGSIGVRDPRTGVLFNTFRHLIEIADFLVGDDPARRVPVHAVGVAGQAGRLEWHARLVEGEAGTLPTLRLLPGAPLAVTDAYARAVAAATLPPPWCPNGQAD